MAALIEVHGTCDERFEPLRDLLGAHLNSGVDEGASFAVNLGGECVVDLWGGYRNLAHTEPWERDTVARVFSTSKVVVTIAALMLWDRGLLDLDTPIATYWPEFAQNGKAMMTTRHVLVHRSGLPGVGCAPTPADARDWDRMIDIVERAAAWYEPGTLTCYSPLTFGYILGELVHRITGLSFAQFVAQEITDPLGADFHYTLSAPDDLARVSEVRPVPKPWDAMSGMGTRIQAEVSALIKSLHTTDLFDAVIPAGGGISNARALTRIGSIMALRGEVDDRRYLSREAVDEAAREQSHDEDLYIGVRVRRGLHFGLDSDTMGAPTPTTIHWGGYGGSWLSMDPASGISCAYTPNRLLDGDDYFLRQVEQWQALLDSLANLG